MNEKMIDYNRMNERKKLVFITCKEISNRLFLSLTKRCVNERIDDKWTGPGGSMIMNE